MLYRRALFLDRDGVINEDREYVHARRDFIWCDGIFDLARIAHARGFALIVVTNQSGIGRGLYTEAAFIELAQWMCAQMQEQGAPIEGVYFCPYHPDAALSRYRTEHPWRKPAPGMLLQARDDLGLDLAKSFLIGDRWSDIAAAALAGVGTSLLIGDVSDVESLQMRPSAVVRSVRIAVDWFERQTANHLAVSSRFGSPPLRILGPANCGSAFD